MNSALDENRISPHHKKYQHKHHSKAIVMKELIASKNLLVIIKNKWDLKYTHMLLAQTEDPLGHIREGLHY